MSLVQTKPAKAERKPKGHGHLRRGEILEAAEKIFVEVGYDGATIRRIAEEVGLSSTALYMHFPDKRAILLEICESAFALLLASNAAILAEPTSAEIKVRKMLQAYADFGLENPNAYSLIYLTRPQEAAQGTEDVAREVGMTLYDRFLGPIRELAEQGRLRRSPEVTGRLLWAGLHGVVSLWITKPWFEWGERDALIEATIETLLDGLLVR